MPTMISCLSYLSLQVGHDSEAMYRDCGALIYDKQDRVIVRCEVDHVDLHMGLYVHARYPKANFTDYDLDTMKAQETKVSATLFVDDKPTVEASGPLFSHWGKEEL